MTRRDEASGLASRSISKALLLGMNDHKPLAEPQILGVRGAASATHETVLLNRSPAQ